MPEVNIPELQKQVTVSLGLIVAIAVGFFLLGGTVVKVLDLGYQMELNKENLEKDILIKEHFLNKEIEGLRSDWKRSRLEDIKHNESNHKLIRDRLNKLER